MLRLRVWADGAVAGEGIYVAGAWLGTSPGSLAVAKLQSAFLWPQITGFVSGRNIFRFGNSLWRRCFPSFHI